MRPVLMLVGVAVLSLATSAACRGTQRPSAATPAQATPEGRVGAGSSEPVAGNQPALMTSHPPTAVPTSVDKVAPPAGGMSIADVWAKRTALSGQSVTVRGKVVKANDNIMGRNWVHLQDGSGSADDRTHDLTITTTETFAEGDVITVTGVLAVDKDFGAGYAYGAILENATVVR